MNDASGYSMHGVPSTSVVMPTYNRRWLLPRILGSLLGDPALDELIVVVDGSLDGSYDLLCDVARSELKLKPQLIPNVGEAAARTHGVQQATGEIVVILDDDVEAAPGLVSHHVRHHADHPDLLVVGYMPVADPEPLGARLYADRYEQHCQQWIEHPETVLRTLWAGNISLRRKAYLDVVARPSQHRYDFHADRVFGLRCAEAGLRGVFDPTCQGIHHYSRSVSGLARDSHNQGLALIRLHEEFPDDCPPLRGDQFTWYLPRYQHPLVEFCRRRRAGSAVSTALRAAIRLADGLGLPKTAELATLMMTIERQRGAIAASEQLRDAPPGRGATNDLSVGAELP